jgi:hypothetical protein
MTTQAQISVNGSHKMRNRQRVLRNLIALVGVGKAAVIGSGLALALFGYVDLAQHLLPGTLMTMIVEGVTTEAVASVGGIVGVTVSLIAGLLR